MFLYLSKRSSYKQQIIVDSFKNITYKASKMYYIFYFQLEVNTAYFVIFSISYIVMKLIRIKVIFIFLFNIYIINIL